MSVNKHKPHVLVLPEDDANRELANGFLLDAGIRIRNIQVLPEAGGWLELLSQFKSDHADAMSRFEQRFMVLLIDCDGKHDRLSNARNGIPIQLKDRVFIIGIMTEPEDLRKELGSYESIGLKLAKDCRENGDSIWGHALLKHNSLELVRMRECVGPILSADSK